jgi:ADP-ribosylglycohydrolase
MTIPANYVERVYAGVLGKIIGVYLGRPFEGWTYERILAELGEITYYVHEKRDVPLIVTDDDISGTFTFLRAMPDYNHDRALTPAQIGQTWLNYLIEGRTVLWWGGLGNSTEHTAYLRLKNGVAAPASGAITTNGQVVAEQIGSQIFIDGWAMIAPGDPELAADLARRAASVSHAGEAIYGAQVIAAMEAQAFVENDLNQLIDTALQLIPPDSIIYRLIEDVRNWHARWPDWREARQAIVAHYGYDRYGGNCHIVPNHALIHLALQYGNNDFQKSLSIVNTSGWDTDCNSGNVGCLLGIKNGLAGIDAGPDFRSPIADRLYLATADGGRAITDAALETYHIVNIARSLSGQASLSPKNGARFHFELPGSVQGFQRANRAGGEGQLVLENVAGHSRAGARCLALHYRGLITGEVVQAATPTFMPPEALTMAGYELMASPTLYAGQQVRGRVTAAGENKSLVSCRLFISVYGADDRLTRINGPEARLAPGEAHEFDWRVPDTGGSPVAEIGLELSAGSPANGDLFLDYLTWDGTPDIALTRPDHAGNMWRRAWVNGVDLFDPWAPEPFRLIQNRGRGLLIQGCREWTDYQVSADCTPHLATAAGLAARVQGMGRYYALLLVSNDRIRLVKALDGEAVLAEAAYPWVLGTTYHLSLSVVGNWIRAEINGQRLFNVQDATNPFVGGAVALVCEVGRTATQTVRVQPCAP